MKFTSTSENQIHNYPLCNILVLQTIWCYTERSKVSYIDFYPDMCNYSSRKVKVKKILKNDPLRILRENKCILRVKFMCT